MEKRIFDVSVGSPASMDSRDEGTVTLRIEDSLSNTLLVALELSPGKFWRLLQGQHMMLEGDQSSDLTHVGEKMRVETLNVPKYVTEGTYDSNEQAALVDDWVGLNTPKHWEKTRKPYLTNHGWTVTGEWYVNVTDQELADYKKGFFI